MGVKWEKCRAGSEYGCRAKGLVGGRKVGLRWKGFTGDVLTVERSGY
jgi:hypothetical protein